MPTVAEVLKQSGFTDAEIAALDARAITAFGGVLTSAEQAQADAVAKAAKAEADYQATKTAKEAAELQDRLNQEFWNNTVNPNLTEWDKKLKEADGARINAEAIAEFYKKQNEGARTAGFVPTEAPAFVPTLPARAPSGQYVPNAPGSTPGSPTFTMEQIDQRLGNGVSNIGWAMQEYQRLTGGQFLPDSFDRLAQEATSQKLEFRDYVARKYDFQGKQQAIVQKQAEERDNKIRAEKDAEWQVKLEAEKATAAKALADKERAFAETSMGSNPDVRTAVPSKMVEVTRAVAEGKRSDPLKMNDNERQQATRQSIRERILERAGTAA